MQAEVTTKFKMTESVMVFDIKLLPRGSGNRAAAKRLAAQFKADPRLAAHILKVVVGSSRVTVHFNMTLELLSILRELKAEELRRRRDKSQLNLFAGIELA